MKKKNQKENLKPNGFAWVIYQFYAKLRMKRKNKIHYEIDEFKKRNKKQGCVVIYNHFSNQDHFISAGMFGTTRANYVVTKRFLFFPAIRTVLNIVKAITRDQFKNDTSSILKMKRVVERGGVICIAPAGQVSIDGESPYINPIIVKLLKMCKADVYTMQTTGVYLSYPKWGLSKRRYPITVKCVKTLSKEELKELSQDECYKRIYEDLNLCDRTYQKNHMIKIKGKNLSHGLENILYICPKCQKKYTIYTKQNDIICRNCGNTITYNQYGFLEGRGNDYYLMQDEAVWYNYQKHLLINQIKNKSYYLKSNVDLYSNTHQEYKLEKVGYGVLVYNIDSLFYDGTKDGVNIHKEFNLHTLYQLPFAPGERFNIPDEEGLYEFVPENLREVIEWVQVIDALNEIKQEEECDVNSN